ncbi:hypothetical protein, partial [Streptomyces acidicola]|uniref:hypothetical protein n=1 Tax=Streptomyces acidicola TaxID=2596892 RepID=UPI00380FA61B
PSKAVDTYPPAYDQPDLPSTHTTTEFNELPVGGFQVGNYVILKLYDTGRNWIVDMCLGVSKSTRFSAPFSARR